MDYDLGWLVGRALVEVKCLGHGSWRFGFGEAASVRADCPWRLIRGGSIALSSEDHGHPYGLPQPIDAEAECRALVGGSVVRAVAVREESRDIIIAFESGARLEVIPLSSGYESWQVFDPGGLWVIAQGGGSLAVWGPHAEPGAAADRGRM